MNNCDVISQRCKLGHMDQPSLVSAPQITRVILYVRDIPKVAAFYQRFFNLSPLPGATDSWLELAASSGGCSIALHKAAVSQKSGAAMKIVFGVADVRSFKLAAEKDGLKFGVVHKVGDLEFANAKDPAGNSIQISNRARKKELEGCTRRSLYHCSVSLPSPSFPPIPLILKKISIIPAMQHRLEEHPDNLAVPELLKPSVRR
jgi:predicted enzyme related to lactoylglutathione lyase